MISVVLVKGGIIMWNSKRSVNLSIAITLSAGAAIIVTAVSAPWLVRWFAESYHNNDGHFICTVLIAGYSCLLPAAAAILKLMQLLLNIRAGKIFIPQNEAALRVLSWCCFAISAVTFVAGFFYVTFFLVTAASLFIGLILRVIKNVFQTAGELKSENDLTI